MKKIFFLLFIFFIQESCDKARMASYKIEGKHQLVTFNVDGADSLTYLNYYTFNCSDYFFEFNYLEDKGDPNWVSIHCNQNDSIFTVNWKNTDNTLFFDSTYRFLGFGPWLPFGGEPYWQIVKLTKKEFIISRGKDGKNYQAHFKKIN